MRNAKKLKKVVACMLTTVLAVGLIKTLPASLASAQTGDGNNFKVWLDELAKDGVVEPGAYEYGSAGTVTLVGNGTEKFTQSYNAAVGVVRDGETVNGYKAGNRHKTANDIPSIPAAGDGCCVEFEAKVTGTFKIYFQSTSFVRVWTFNTATGERIGDSKSGLDSEVAADSFAFKAEAGKTYVMSTTGKTNNMAYIGYQFIEDIPATVAVEQKNISVAESVLTNLEVYLTDSDLGGDPAAVLKKGDTSVTLAKGHTYTVSTNDGGVRAVVGDKDTFVCTGDKVTVDLHNIPDVQLTGTITGAEAGTVTELKFKNMINGAEYTATISGTSYTCTMKPGEYETSVVAANGGFTKDRVSVKEDGENVNEVWVEFPVESGAVSYAPDDMVNFTATGSVSSRGNDFTAGAGSTLTVPISGASVVTVKAYYNAWFEINGQAYAVETGSTSQIDEFKVNASSDLTITFTGSKTSYLTGIEVAPTVEFKNTISVPGDYATMKEAVAAIKGMSSRPDGEAGRVTINLTADLFEQVVVDAPYVTLNGNNHEIAWYYGVGTFYYSIDPATGLYNERLARDKYSYTEGDGNLWGGVFIVRGNNFIANNTIFKNTYNYELTEAELSDIHHTVSGMPARVEGTDVTAYASKERSNAFYIDADNIECYNCKILASQDTLGRNGSTNNNYHTYFKDCVIGGNTDYICGEFAAIFDNCELQWKTFKDDEKNNAKVGYIVAPKTSPYVFRNCVVTTDGVGTGVKGYYGRTWGDNSNCSFINTETNGLINGSGWDQMSNSGGDTAVFNEYSNTQFGESMYTKWEFTKEDSQTLAAVENYIDSDTVSAVTTVLNGWNPVSYAQTKIDYTKVGTQLGKVDALDASIYTKESYAKVTDLVKSIEWAGAAQTYLDEMADKIAAAIAALEIQPLQVVPEADSNVSSVVASEDIKVVTEEGKEVAGGNLTVEESKATDKQVDAVKEAIAEEKLDIDTTAMEVIDLSLKTDAGKVVKLSDGNIKITLKKDTTVDYTKYDLVIYHLKDDGKLEKLDLTFGDDTVSFTTTSLSPFVKVYVPKQASAGDGSGVATGDATPAALYAVMALFSLATLLATALFRRKNIVK